MYFSDDPVADYDRHCRLAERKLVRYPRCSDCHEHIQDETFYNINGMILCEECIKGYQYFTDEFVNEEGE